MQKKIISWKHTDGNKSIAVGRKILMQKKFIAWKPTDGNKTIAVG
jgi:hypothetical protein